MMLAGRRSLELRDFSDTQLSVYYAEYNSLRLLDYHMFGYNPYHVGVRMLIMTVACYSNTWYKTP